MVHHTAEEKDRARDYIDSILAIYQKYGMQHQPLSTEDYEKAVDAAIQLIISAKNEGSH